MQQIHLKVPDVGVPVGGAGDDPVGLGRPVDPGDPEVVLVQSGRLLELPAGLLQDLEEAKVEVRVLPLNSDYLTRLFTSTSLLFLEMATELPSAFQAWVVRGETPPKEWIVFISKS